MAAPDLIAVWEEHLGKEFIERDVDAPTDTMGPEPHVNHVPTMTGGVGREELKRFYKYHFVPAHPHDTEIVPVSRTVGESTIVDEMVVKFTHDRVIDYLLPGIAPTGLPVEIAAVVVAQLLSEHIYWDQVSVLVQLGKLDPKGLPVGGVEVSRARSWINRCSNRLMVEGGQAVKARPSDPRPPAERGGRK